MLNNDQKVVNVRNNNPSKNQGGKSSFQLGYDYDDSTNNKPSNNNAFVYKKK